eukprot:COSAG02_NODE_1283_length_13471_cov_12.121223_5_plen_147_part_00
MTSEGDPELGCPALVPSMEKTHRVVVLDGPIGWDHAIAIFAICVRIAGVQQQIVKEKHRASAERYRHLLVGNAGSVHSRVECDRFGMLLVREHVSVTLRNYFKAAVAHSGIIDGYPQREFVCAFPICWVRTKQNVVHETMRRETEQ